MHEELKHLAQTARHAEAKRFVQLQGELRLFLSPGSQDRMQKVPITLLKDTEQVKLKQVLVIFFCVAPAECVKNVHVLGRIFEPLML